MSDEAKAKEKQVLVGGGMGMIVCTSLYTPHPSFPPTPPLKQHPLSSHTLISVFTIRSCAFDLMPIDEKAHIGPGAG